MCAAVAHCLRSSAVARKWRYEDLLYAQCWDDAKIITVKVADSCPCKYFIKYTGETRTQPACCGGHNHFDLSYWAFQQVNLSNPISPAVSSRMAQIAALYWCSLYMDLMSE
jgi:hypothetical protein